MKSVGEGAKAAASDAADSIGGMMGALGDAFSGAVDTATDIAKKAMDNAPELTDALDTVLDNGKWVKMSKDMVKKMGKMAKKQIEAATNAMTKFREEGKKA